MLEEILEQIFYRTAAVYKRKYPPTRQEVLDVVKPIAETMREMNLTIINDHLLTDKNE